MAGNKKPRKTKNAKSKFIKLIHEQTRKAIKGNYIAFLAREGELLRSYDINGEVSAFSEHLQKSLEKTPILWCIVGYVFCRDHNGVDYMKSIAIDAPYPCKREQIKTIAADKIWQFLKSDCNENHILGAGWLSTDASNEPEDEIADKIFTHIGVWDELAPWQEEAARNGNS